MARSLAFVATALLCLICLEAFADSFPATPPLRQPAASPLQPEKIPVTVLTGFLGSGKTTFINYVKTANHGQKIAVVENEFGEVGIDEGLVVQTKEDVIEMMNGCICCTVREDLIGALKNLAENRRDQFDAVIIETTGLADPAPVAQTFFVDETIRSLFRLDAIVTFADCYHITEHLDEVKPEGVENKAVEQVAFADVLVLNKIDLVQDDKKVAVRTRLREINAAAKVLECTHSRVPLDQVLNIRAFDLDRTLQMDDTFLDTDGEHMHDRSVSSVGFVIEGELHPDKLNNWLQELLQNKGTDLFRSKGILAIIGSEDKYVFQPGEKKMNRLCFIGRNLDKKQLESSLRECVFDGKIPDPGPVPTKKLRFPVGSKVEVNVGEWVPGVVVRQWYREELWETGRYAPYQVKIEECDDAGEQMVVWAPRDANAFIRTAAAS